MGWIRKLFGLDFMSEEDKKKMQARVTSYEISVATVAIRKLAFENEKRTNPNTKFEYIGLTCFNVYDLNHQSSRDYQK